MSGRTNFNKQEIEQPEAVFIFTPCALLLFFSLKVQTNLMAAEAAVWVWGDYFILDEVSI